jgi:MFS family permease
VNDSRVCCLKASIVAMGFNLRLVSMRMRKLSTDKLQYRGLSSSKTDKYYIFRTLGLETFSDSEMRKSYREIFLSPNKGDLETPIKEIIRRKESNFRTEDELTEKARHIATYLLQKKAPQKSFNYSPMSWFTSSKREEKEEETTIALSPNLTLSYDDFKARLRTSAEKLDLKIPEVAASAVLTGTSIGIIIPCMPILVQTIGIAPSEFGIVVAAFGVSKIFGNLPAATFTDTYGRKPAMVAGLALCGIGIGGIGLTLVDGFGTPWLIGCRLVSGLGVSLFVGGTMALLGDLSTPLNRTRTTASVMAGFQGGTALGPALGGVMISNVGVGATYFAVGGCFAVMASLHHMFLNETMPEKILPRKNDKKNADDKAVEKGLLSAGLLQSNSSASAASASAASASAAAAGSSVLIAKPRGGAMDSIKDRLLIWKELAEKPAVRKMMMLYSAYWMALSGSQMTLLPLMMVGPVLHLSGSDIGLTFTFMAITSVVFSQPVAYLADKHGKINCMIGGCALAATSMIMMPHADSLYYLLAATVPLALGSTAMSTAPAALITDMVSGKEMANAQALLRTSGDVGLLLGALAAGQVASQFSIETTISGCGVLLAGTSLWYAAKSVNLQELQQYFSKDPTITSTSDAEGNVVNTADREKSVVVAAAATAAAVDDLRVRPKQPAAVTVTLPNELHLSSSNTSSNSMQLKGSSQMIDPACGSEKVSLHNK